MPIAGASTTIAASKTAAEVTAMLAKNGAKQVMTTYDDNGEATGIAFIITTEHGERAFTLPVRPEGVRKALIRDRVIPSRQTVEHAQRVAWRIARDWLRAQLAIIDAGLVTLDEIMLPYAMIGGTTMYEAVRERGLKGAIER